MKTMNRRLRTGALTLAILLSACAREPTSPSLQELPKIDYGKPLIINDIRLTQEDDFPWLFQTQWPVKRFYGFTDVHSGNIVTISDFPTPPDLNPDGKLDSATLRGEVVSSNLPHYQNLLEALDTLRAEEPNRFTPASALTLKERNRYPFSHSH